MIVDTERLVKQATYAKMKGVSRQRISLLVLNNKIESVIIDGIPFVVLDKNEKINFKNS